MNWLQRYRVRNYLQNSIWLFPAASIVLAMAIVRLLHGLETALGWRSDLDPETVRSVLGTLAGALFTFIVFVCSSLLLVVQLASAQLTPRIVSVLLRDGVTKLTLSLFVFTFAFAVATLVRIGATVPQLTAEIAAYGSAACIGLFLFLIDHVAKMLRPSAAVRSIAVQGHQVIESVYPRRLKDHPSATGDVGPLVHGGGHTVYSIDDGVVLAFNLPGIVRLATRHDCLVELVPQVGVYVAPGNPLFRVHGAARDLAVSLESELRLSVALGQERTVEQDPAFAFRVLVDIASKGLSPGINDPTTAVLVVDQIHHLLKHVGSRRLDDERVRDAAGKIRLVYRTPDWEDYVTLAITEIRQFGGGSIQIVRRLRALLEDLVRSLPEERLPPLQHELQILHKAATRFFQDPADQALAEISDVQGVGGTRENGKRLSASRSERSVGP